MDLASTVVFLRAVHPGHGVLSVVSFPRDTKSGHKPVSLSFDTDDRDEYEAAAKKIVELEHRSHRLRDCSVRVHPASFAIGSRDRRRDSVTSSKTWFVDLDLHDAKAGSLDEVLPSALSKLAAAGVPEPTMVLDSGWGAHLLWVARHPLDPAKWADCAARLAYAAGKLELPIDLQCTTSIVRPLRVPGSTNWRDPNNPRTVRLLRVGKAVDPDSLLALPAPRIANGHDDGAAFTSSIPRKPSPPWTIRAAMANCNQIRSVYETRGAYCNEPQWRAMVQLCAFAADGDQMVHELSKGHSGYSVEETNKKLATVRAQLAANPSIRPHTCSRIRELFGPEKCRGCSVSANVRTPADAAHPSIALPSERYVVVTPEVVEFGKKPGIYHLEPTEVSGPDGQVSTTLQWIQIAPFVLTDFKFNEMHDGVNPSHVIQALNSRSQIVTFKMNSLADGRDMSKALAAAGLDQVPKPGSFLSFLQEIRSKLAPRDATPTTKLGLVQRSDGRFDMVHGESIYSPDGGVSEPHHSDDQTIAAMFDAHRPSGSKEAWSNLAKRVLADRRPAVHCMMGLSAGSPLVAFTDKSCLICALYSPYTGVGKTTVLRFAQALWGRPTAGGVSTAADSRAALGVRLSVMNSLPVFQDEYRVVKSEDQALADIFSLEAGVDRARCDTTGRIRPRGTWRNIIFYATNFSIAQRMAESVHGEPGSARILQLRLSKITEEAPGWIDPTDMATIHSTYGWAGPTLGPVLAQTEPEVLRLALAKMEGTLRARALSDPILRPHVQSGRLRFALTAAAVGIYGGLMGRKVGLLPGWDQDLAWEGFKSALHDMAAVMGQIDRTQSVSAVVSEAIAALRHRMLTRLEDASLAPILPMSRHAQIAGEIDLRTQKATFLRSAFMEWVAKAGLRDSPAIENLCNNYAADSEIAPDIPSLSLPAMPCIVVPISGMDIPLQETADAEVG